MTSHLKSAALAVAILAGAALVPASASAATCKLTADEKYHRANNKLPTYTRSLKVSGGATCATGHKMIREYYKCRVAPPSSGKAGRCTKRVLGYSCSERRSNVIKTQFDARVTCKKGRARILTDYTQFV
ncbi:MAG TPA: hypothetical protein VFZ89_15600 [Solirubrobacteraceae bacterium]